MKSPTGRYATILLSWSAAVGAAILLWIGALGYLRAQSPTAVPAAPDTRPLAATPSSLYPAPDFEIVMYQGQSAVGGSKVRLSQLWRRGKPIVLNFFAGLCPPCRAEMPDLQRLYDTNRSKVQLISVDVGPYVGLGSREEAKALLRALRITFPAGTVFDEDILVTYQILGMPTTVFITADGKILRKHTGLLTYEQMTVFSDELVRASRAR
ncbi:MAG: TlpA family protein disulfide reductase [bacterium]